MATSLNRLAEVASCLEVHVVEEKLRYHLRTYKNAFIGSKAVDYMCSNGFANSRDEAIRLGNLLLTEGFIRHVHGDHAFKDDYLFYNVLKSTPFTYTKSPSGTQIPETVDNGGPTNATKSSSPNALDSRNNEGKGLTPERMTKPKTENKIGGNTVTPFSKSTSVLGISEDIGTGKRTQRLDLLEILMAKCNEKANYLDMELAQLSEAVRDTTKCLAELKHRCDSMQHRYLEILGHCHQQARVMVAMGVLFAANISVSHGSSFLFLATLIGILVLGRDAFLIGGLSGDVKVPPRSQRSRSDKKQGVKEKKDAISLQPRSAPNRNNKECKFNGQYFRHLRLTDMMSMDNALFPEGLEFNTTEGIPFETELFKGKVVFKLRPSDDAELSREYRNYFKGRARKFSLQIQGKFKRPSKGIVWLGAEVGHCDGEKEDRMELGFVRKTVCKIVLSTINLMRGAILHYSFGDGDQLPHITLPLFLAADTFVETGQHDMPPELGVGMFPEDEKSRKMRRKSSANDRYYNTTSTYSFSLHNGNLDLYNWTVVGIPGVKSMDLTQYWKDMPLRIVAYMTDGPFATPHSSVKKKYLFCFKLSNSNIV
eukprot:CAMPEP_0184479734 /NCGR_PEP_ID=MMETSP0113_2-20130426/1341_1 /TAXON_ID=91329 /ORGANISM="Norrisiella sphaerica, Strain BC52" /LENGTH=594 /DNA_ID=CAMNT_0026857875 /DNA_START=129 /DNA_END=1913 /DNA_ORIENTATION=-